MYRKIFSNGVHGAAAGISRLKKKLGAAPGTVEYTGTQPHAETKVHIADYDATDFRRWSGGATEAIPKQSLQNRWIQVSGLSDTAFIKKLGAANDIPALVLEDIVTPSQSAKIENCDHFLFVVLKVPVFSENTFALHFEHLSILLFENRVISFQESDTFHFEKLISRLENPEGRMRVHGCDYFLYAMIDLVVDIYMFLSELFKENLYSLEEEVLDKSHRSHVNRIHDLKRRIASTRKAIRPLRVIGDSLTADNVPHISKDIDMYIRDLRDHIQGLLDSFEGNHEGAAMLMDSYLSLTSHQMNEVMKVLTMMSAIFIPLAFIAGLYGMNFDHMPGLHYKHGYFVVLGVMITIVSGMLLYFKYKRWL